MKAKINLGARTLAFPEEIILLKAQENYTYVHFKNGKRLLTAINIGALENRLADFNFFRANRSTLVNLDYRNHFSFLMNISQMQGTKDTEKILIKVARRRVDEFRKYVKRRVI